MTAVARRPLNTYPAGIISCTTLDDYIKYYNTDRLHCSLDIDNYETPMMAFRNKVTNEIKQQNPKWMEEGIND